VDVKLGGARVGHAFLVCALLAGLATAAQTRELVLTTAARPPLSTVSQDGFVDRVIGAAAARIGYTLRIVHQPAERALLSAESGLSDGELQRVAGLQERYPNLRPLTERTMQMEFVAFSKHVRIATSDWNSLLPYSVGIVRGWKIVEQRIPTGVRLVKVKDVAQLLKMLQRDRLEIVIATSWLGRQYLVEHRLSEIAELDPPLARTDMFVYLHRRRADLVPELSAALRAVKEDGTYQRLEREILLPLRR